MKHLATLAATISIVCAMMFAGADAATAAATYELVIVPPANANASPGIFRIDVANGQVVNAWGWGTSATSYAPVADAAALPQGGYHLYLVESLDQKGNWELVRFDTQSGRIWSISGGGNAPLIWTEATAPPAAPIMAPPAAPITAPPAAPK